MPRANTTTVAVDLVIWLLLFKQKRMRFEPIKSRLFRWMGGQEQYLKQ